MPSRRHFLAGLAAASSLPAMGWAAAGSPVYLAAARDPSGDYALFGLDGTGHDIFRIPDERKHQSPYRRFSQTRRLNQF